MKSMNCTSMTDSTQKSDRTPEVNIFITKVLSGVHL